MKKLYGSTHSSNISAEKLEKMKISFLFSALLLLSTVCGILITNYISEELYPNSLFRVSTHFETAFLKSAGLIDSAKIIAIYSLPDIISFLIIFAASFSIVNYLISDIIIIYSGIRFGVSVAFLINFANKSSFSYSVGNVRLWLFILTNLMMLSTLLYYAYQAAISSVSFRRTDPNGRPNIKTKDFITFALKSAACIGIVFMLNTLYCFFIYMLK